MELCHAIEDPELEEHAEPVIEARNVLDHDRRIVLIGGGRCGKSSLLAGLLGAPTLASCAMEGHYTCWRYVCRDGDATASRFVPLPSLNGLELVDTADCADAQVRETCLALMRGAEVVIGVVDGRAPEASPVWDTLSDLTEQELSDCLLVITFTDTMGAEEALKLKDVLRDLCLSRVRFSLPLYFVCSGDARSMDTFRSRVQEAMLGPDGLRAAIRSLAERAADLVDKQSRILRVRRAASLTDNSFISSIDQEIDNFLSHQMLGLSAHQENLNAALKRVLPPLLQRVRSYFGHGLSPSTLLRLELLGADTDRALYRHMEEEVKEMQTESDRQFSMSCALHWRSVRPRMKKTIECEIGDFPEPDLENELGDLRKRLCGELYEPFANTGLRHQLFRLFIAQAGWMRACMIFICFLLTAAGALGFVGLDMPAVCCVASAAMVWLVGTIGSHLACRHICREVTRLAEGLRIAMELSMRGVLERLIVSRVAAYRRLYIRPRQKVARQDAMLEPLQQRQKEIYLQLRTLIPRL